MYIIYEKRKDQKEYKKTNLQYKRLAKAAEKIKILKKNFKNLDCKLMQE